MRFLSFLIASAICLFGIHCKKNNPNSDNGLPPATQTGQGVFACRMNGEPWISKRGRPDMGVYYTTDTLITGGTVSDNAFLESLNINLLGIFSTAKQVYQLTDSAKAFVAYSRVGGTQCFNGGNYGGITKKITNGTVTITKADTVNKIFSGTFNFVIPTDFCDTLKITDGRFDIKQR